MYRAVDAHLHCTSRFLIITVFTVLTVRSVAAMPSRDARSVASSLELSIAKEVPPIVTSVKANGRTKRHESARNDRRNLTTEKTSSDVDAIKFPDESHGIQSRNFVPVPDPSCDGKTFCEETSAYPQEYVSNVISGSGNIQGFSGVDKIRIIDRVDSSDGGEALCGSETKVVFPKTARSEDMEWLFIVQDEKKGYKQGVKVENCDEGTIEGACKIIEGSIFGYKTSCKQKFVSRVLAAVGKNGTAITEKFSMPSSCCCQIKLVGADAIGSRLSGGAGKNQGPAPAKRGRRY